MERAIIGLLVLALFIAASIMLRAGVAAGWNKLSNKTAGNAEDKRRRALLGESSNSSRPEPTRIDDTERRE